MKALIGVDAGGQYVSALRLLGRLAFEQPEWHLLHAYWPDVGADWTGHGQAVTSQLLAAERRDAEQLLETAANDACAYGMKATTHLVSGHAGSYVIDEADKLGVDLIAIGSNDKGAIASALLGSVGRALAIGARQSFLIGRGPIEPQGYIAAVFATDHSAYCQRALTRLCEFRPRGLKKIRVVTAGELPGDRSFSLRLALKRLAKEEGTTVDHLLAARSKAAVSELEAAGFEAEFLLEEGSTREAIEHSMQATNADLLIVGAQGHGFIDRLLAGSTALDFVVSGEWPLMVLRAPRNGLSL